MQFSNNNSSRRAGRNDQGASTLRPSEATLTSHSNHSRRDAVPPFESPPPPYRRHDFPSGLPRGAGSILPPSDENAFARLLLGYDHVWAELKSKEEESRRLSLELGALTHMFCQFQYRYIRARQFDLAENIAPMVELVCNNSICVLGRISTYYLFPKLGANNPTFQKIVELFRWHNKLVWAQPRTTQKKQTLPVGLATILGLHLEGIEHYDDLAAWIRDPSSFLVGQGLNRFYERCGAVKLALLVHKFALSNAPGDAWRASLFALESDWAQSDADKIDFAATILFLASSNISLFEEFPDTRYLDNAMDLLQLYLSAPNIDHAAQLMASGHLMSTLTLYHLQTMAEEPLEEGLKIFYHLSTEKILENRVPPHPRYILVCSVILWRRPFISEDQFLVLDLLYKMLTLFPSPQHFQYSVREILVISLLLDISRSFDPPEFISSLHWIISVLQREAFRLRPPFPAPLLSAIDDCIAAFPSTAVCLLYQGDLLAARANEIKPLELYRQVDDDLDYWESEWKDGQNTLKALGQGSSSDFTFPTPSIFRFYAPLCPDEYQGGEMNIHFREDPDPRTHRCWFQFKVRRADTNDKPLSQEIFIQDLEGLCSSLSNEDHEYYIENPSHLKLPHQDELPPSWVNLDCIKALLLLSRYRKKGTSSCLSKACHILLTYKPDYNPTYVDVLYRVASYVARDWGPEDQLGNAINLYTSVLRVQEKKTPKHFVTMIVLCMVMLRDWSSSRDTRRFVVALEIFREAVAARGGTHWMADGRRAVVVGWILCLRWRTWNDSNECYEQAMTILESIFRLISPPTVAGWTSTLETLLISTFSFLARNLRQRAWILSLRFLEHSLHSFLDDTPNSNKSKLFDPSFNKELLASIRYDGIDICAGIMANGTLDLLHMADTLCVVSEKLFSDPNAMRLPIKMVEEAILSTLDEYNLSAAPPQGPELDMYILVDSWSKTVKRWCDCLESYVSQTSTPGECPQNLLLYEAHFGYRPIVPSREARGLSSGRVQFEVAILQGHMPVCFLREPPSRASSTTAIASIESWPPLLVDDREGIHNRSGLPSNATMPWIDDVTLNKNHPQFSLPIQGRTQAALMQLTWWQSRSDAHTTAGLYQKVIGLYTRESQMVFDPNQLPLDNQLKSLKGFSHNLSGSGSLYVLVSLGPEKCLETVDASRTLFWNRLLRLKVSFEGVPQPLKQDLENAAEVLEHHVHSTATGDEGRLPSDIPKRTIGELVEWRASESAFLRLLSKLRELPGFEDFLRPKSCEKLLHAARGGSVVVIVGSTAIYAALIIQPKGVCAVSLPGVSEEVISSWVDALAQETEMARKATETFTDPLDRALKPFGKKRPTPFSSKIYTALAGVWTRVVKPILSKLELSPIEDIEKRPRLWWCPTGQMTRLPIHAAGTGYGTKKIERTSDYILSSYIPTPGTLVNLFDSNPESRVLPQRSDLTVLALSQPTTTGLPPLPSTIAELDAIEEIVPSSQLIKCEHTTAASDKTRGAGIPEKKNLSSINRNKTAQDVLTSLPLASVLHLACHGSQNRTAPLQSGFHLEGGKLTLSKLISCHMPHAFLAFLSACESASSDIALPDESLSLAAAMLYAGFPSVIGTMWSMNDADGPRIAKIFYEELFRQPDQLLDGRRVSIALQKAIRTLEDSGVPAGRWATYIQVGI